MTHRYRPTQRILTATLTARPRCRRRHGQQRPYLRPHNPDAPACDDASSSRRRFASGRWRPELPSDRRLDDDQSRRAR